MLPAATVDRFWDKVRKSDDGCWEWTASTSPTGYGKFLCRTDEHTNLPRLAHRVSWALTMGRWPSPSEYICHRCDNPKCVRPEHLFLGDAKTNMVDMVKKGRWDAGGGRGTGERNGNHRLSTSDVEEMRRLYSSGEWSISMLAARFACSKSTAARNVRGDNWRHLQPGNLPTDVDRRRLKSSRLRDYWKRRRSSASATESGTAPHA